MSEGSDENSTAVDQKLFRVITGPLKGLTGRIVGVREADRVILEAEGVVRGVLFVLDRGVLDDLT